ncbi:MAG: hypothetical protein EXR84_14410 [Gammaproteobacteria bacterium]|nr:hypothetical protein [Gammaproteobacteria bacterium]
MKSQTEYLLLDEAAALLKVSTDNLLLQATEGFLQAYWLLNKTLQSDMLEQVPAGVFPAYPGQDIEEWSSNLIEVASTKHFTFIPLDRDKAGELLTKSTTECQISRIRTPEGIYSLAEPNVITITRQHVAIMRNGREAQRKQTPDNDYESELLRLVNRASKEFWSTADRDDKSTYPKNSDIATWLMEQDFTKTLADKAATIIRPEWAPKGRRPEE